GGENRESVLSRDRRERAPQFPQLRPRVGHVRVRRGDDLDLGLQELARDASAGRAQGSLEESIRHSTCDQFGLRIDQKVLLFDTELEITDHATSLLVALGAEPFYDSACTATEFRESGLKAAGAPVNAPHAAGFRG